jgi:hypothetical protein
MPVSKKRKKDGKPVHRSVPAPEPAPQGEEGHAPVPQTTPQARMGRPSNPFVASQQGRRASQRGR